MTFSDNKVEPFYTELEIKTLDALLKLQEVLYNEYNTALQLVVEAEELGADLDKAQQRLTETEGRFNETSEEIDTIHERVIQRYIDHFNKDPKALLADIQDIVNEIERKDFIKYLEIYKALHEKRKEEIEKEGGNMEELAELQSRQLRYYSDNTNSAFTFLSNNVLLQLQTLESWGYLTNTPEGQEALRIIKKRALEFCPEEPEEEQGEQLSIFLAPEKVLTEESTPLRKFYKVPTSPATNLITEVLGAGKRLAELPSRKSAVNHSVKYDLKTSGKKKLVTAESASASVAVEITDLEKLRKPAKKLLQLSLIKANEQALHKGQLTKDYINISIQELLELELYTTPQSARTGLKTGAEALYSISINGYLKRGGKKKVEQEVKERLFTGIHRNGRGDYRLFLNSRINWGLLASYYTSLPSYYFKLPDKASDLLFYIFYLARQNTSLLAEQGYFTISFRAIQERLFLPSEKKTKDPQRDIKDIIERAVTEIEDSHRAEYNNTELQLELIGEDKPIASYLDKGYLKVYLSGSFAEPFLDHNAEMQKQISSAKKRQEKIADQAKAINLAKKLEQEAQAETAK